MATHVVTGQQAAITMVPNPLGGKAGCGQHVCHHATPSPQCLRKIVLILLVQTSGTVLLFAHSSAPHQDNMFATIPCRLLSARKTDEITKNCMNSSQNWHTVFGLPTLSPSIIRTRFKHYVWLRLRCLPQVVLPGSCDGPNSSQCSGCSSLRLSQFATAGPARDRHVAMQPGCKKYYF